MPTIRVPRRSSLPGVRIGVLRRIIPLLPLLHLLAPATGRGQTGAASSLETPQRATPQRLDEGSFTILLRGQRVGREQFSVQQLAGADGAVFELRAESAQGDRRTAMRLEADSAGTPVRYSLEEREGAEQTLRLGGQRIRGRFTTLARSVNGEAAREYLLRPGALVVEDEGLVQHALLVRMPLRVPGEAATRPSLTPAANSQGAVHIVLEATADTVTIAGARRIAQRWRVVTASSEIRMVWADPEGRLLRITIPSRGLEARRDDVPR
ncbi:hypothetical protein [Gemmatimonas aurantiaca]|uniref:hypothetical protein n=1 Tax=Gemmatimonas aurantiaca TaxID=173480 RepID=UPI00301D9C80